MSFLSNIQRSRAWVVYGSSLGFLSVFSGLSMGFIGLSTYFCCCGSGAKPKDLYFLQNDFWVVWRFFRVLTCLTHFRCLFRELVRHPQEGSFSKASSSGLESFDPWPCLFRGNHISNNNKTSHQKKKKNDSMNKIVYVHSLPENVELKKSKTKDCLLRIYGYMSFLWGAQNFKDPNQGWCFLGLSIK